MTVMIRADSVSPAIEWVNRMLETTPSGWEDTLAELRRIKAHLEEVVAPPKKTISEAVSTLSTGNENPHARGGRSPYYPHIGQWWYALEAVLSRWGIVPETVTIPFTDCGRGFLTTYYQEKPTCYQGDTYPAHPHEVGMVWYTWHRMPSGNLEIICGYHSAEGE